MDLNFDQLPSHWPPGYPLFLAFLTSIFSNVATAALFGQIILFALNTIAFALVIHYCLSASARGRYWIATLAGVTFACNPAVLLLHQYAVSEALFIFILLSSLGAYLWFMETRKKTQLLIVALVVGCLPVTRYAGLPFIPIFLALIYFGQTNIKQTRRQQSRDALTFSIVSSLPIACWLALNALLRSETTNRMFAYHPFGIAHVKALAESFRSWFEVPGSGALTIIAMLFITLVAVMSVVTPKVAYKQKVLMIGLPISALIYAFFLLVSISFMDAYSPLDQRMLLPSWILIFLAIFMMMQVSMRSRLNFSILLLAIIPVFVEYGLKSMTQIEYGREHGLGFHTRDAATSALLVKVRKEYPERKLYSNASDYIYLHTNLEVQSLPKIYEATSRKLNPRFIYQMAEILEKIDNQEAAIVYIDGFEFRQYYPTAKQLEDEFSLGSTQQGSGGVYFNKLMLKR